MKYPYIPHFQYCNSKTTTKIAFAITAFVLLNSLIRSQNNIVCDITNSFDKSTLEQA